MKKTFLNYPSEFYYLCLTTMCEKFSFHAIRFTLVLYMTKSLLMNDNDAYLINGSSLALTFMFPIIGGWLGDRVLGHHKVCLIGTVFVSTGIMLLNLPYKPTFFLGLGLIACGGGFLRAGIPTLASKFFENKDDLRDSGYTILYSFINLGAFLAVPGSCVIGEVFGWHYNFTISSLIALLSTFFLTKIKNILVVETSVSAPLQERGKNLNDFLVTRPYFTIIFPMIGAIFILYNTVLSVILISSFFIALCLIFYLAIQRPKERNLYLILACCMTIGVVFFSIYEQGASSVSLFIDRHVDRFFQSSTNHLISYFKVSEIPTTVFQAIDPLVNIILGTFLSYLWWKIACNNLSSYFFRFGLGLIFEGIAFLLLSLSSFYMNSQALIPLWMIVVLYIFTVTGELLVAPIAMATITRISPKENRGLALGVWNLSISLGQWMASILSCLASIEDKNITSAMSINIYMKAFRYIAFPGIILGLAVLTLNFMYWKKHYKLSKNPKVFN